MAGASAATATAYLEVFRTAYARDGFDLTAGDSLQMAKQLSLAMVGTFSEIDPEKAQRQVLEDFYSVGNYCDSTTGLNLSKPQCAALATRIAKLGAGRFSNLRRSFESLSDFLRQTDPGPGLTLTEALRLTEEILAYGPHSDENFKNAYQYAQREKGLSLSTQESLLFARRLTQFPAPSTR
jgi:hypothetical protein